MVIKRKACGGFRKSKSLNVDLGEKLRWYFVKGGAWAIFNKLTGKYKSLIVSINKEVLCVRLGFVTFDKVNFLKIMLKIFYHATFYDRDHTLFEIKIERF